uniref:Uncharacterized protein n=1 Tax=uncultured marine bacterium 581 TaxID=257401 RepID=Q6SFF1_9BACT|nr:hypothetical protein MBMO_EBAC000-69B03.16 [uncultured marine bacterium 581]
MRVVQRKPLPAKNRDVSPGTGNGASTRPSKVVISI